MPIIDKSITSEKLVSLFRTPLLGFFGVRLLVLFAVGTGLFPSTMTLKVGS
jgi:hypothetical protein